MRLRLVAVLVLCGSSSLASCSVKYSYGVGFTSCTEGVLTMAVRSSSYSTQGPVPLRRGQMKAEDGINVALPSEMSVDWTPEGGTTQTARYQITSRLPPAFDVGRDTLWFVACSNDRPRLFAEISAKSAIALHDLSGSGRVYSDVSIRRACDLCAASARDGSAAPGESSRRSSDAVQITCVSSSAP